MESEVLGHQPINQLEFMNEQSVHQVPLPDELPKRADLSHLPKDILKSSTVETLISQNEDLMARLKIALRRLSTIELENQKLQKSNDETHRRMALIEDQNLVFREKDRSWTTRLKEVENERDISNEKIQILANRQKELETDLGRYKKYHEKVRLQVKPHLEQLQQHTAQLEKKNQDLIADNESKAALIQDLRHQMAEITRNSRRQVELAESRVHEMIESYESSLAQSNLSLEALRSQNEELQQKAVRLSRSEHQRNEFENENIELRRSREEQRLQFTGEIRRLSEQLQGITKESARLKVENEEMREKILTDHKKIQDLQKSHLDLQSQLESLRYLWASRNEENEKLKLSLNSLEKLNVDLSSKIQQMRNG